MPGSKELFLTCLCTVIYCKVDHMDYLTVEDGQTDSLSLDNNSK